ncbi:MAG: PEP-CTERM sorting domain-containing protein [Sedimentisphaerales bacterium]|nr:PEP-CTERM sorting domain-containing protein [Sedimentisphaerales bacterium]
MNKKLIIVVLLLAVSLLSNASADVIWTGAGADDLWSNSDNWQGGIMPGPGAGNVLLQEANDAGNDLVVIGSLTSVAIDNDVFGPEWGMDLIIDGGSLVQTNPSGFVFAPIGATDNPSIVTVQNGGNLQVHNLLLGDNWWYGDAPAANLEVYDTSTVLATDWCWLGGKMSLYGGTVDIQGGFNMDTNNKGYAGIDIENGMLIIRDDGFTAATAQGWEDSGILTGFGGSGDVIIDDISGDVVITAVIPEPATMTILGLGALLIRRKR